MDFDDLSPEIQAKAQACFTRISGDIMPFNPPYQQKAAQ